jgi:hypothetical protein
LNNLLPIEFKDQRVLTTQQLAQAYETDVKNISKNFNRNQERFILGRDYYAIEGEDLKAFKGFHLNDESLKFVSILYLWTQRGANRHSKILDTDQAWKQFDLLEETYFHVKSGQVPQMSQLEIIAQIARSAADQEKKMLQIEQTQIQQSETLQSMRDVVALSSTSWRSDSSMLISKMARKLGGTEHIQELRNESYKLLNDRMGVDLKCRLTNKRRRMADEGICKSKRDNLNHLDVISDDKKLVEGYIAIVKELAIKYGI